MGLDMYLTRKVFVGATYPHRNVTGTISIQQEGKELKINFNKVSYIEEEAGDWQKSYAIHRWFVDNVKGGEDDAETHYVSSKKLKTLLAICKKVKADHTLAEKLLPVQDGLIFGSTEYDEDYFGDIDYTIDILEEIMKEQDSEGYDKNVEYYYSSLW